MGQHMGCGKGGLTDTLGGSEAISQLLPQGSLHLTVEDNAKGVSSKTQTEDRS